MLIDAPELSLLPDQEGPTLLAHRIGQQHIGLSRARSNHSSARSTSTMSTKARNLSRSSIFKFMWMHSRRASID